MSREIINELDALQLILATEVNKLSDLDIRRISKHVLSSKLRIKQVKTDVDSGKISKNDFLDFLSTGSMVCIFY